MTTALELARAQHRAGDNMFRAGVKVRIFALLKGLENPGAATEDRMDSIFIEAVAAEHRGDKLP